MQRTRGQELDELFEASIAQAVEGIGKRWPELKKDSGIRYEAYKDLIRKAATSINGISFLVEILEIPNQLWHSHIPGSVIDEDLD